MWAVVRWVKRTEPSRLAEIDRFLNGGFITNLQITFTTNVCRASDIHSQSIKTKEGIPIVVEQRDDDGSGMLRQNVFVNKTWIVTFYHLISRNKQQKIKSNFIIMYHFTTLLYIYISRVWLNGWGARLLKITQLVRNALQIQAAWICNLSTKWKPVEIHNAERN